MSEADDPHAASEPGKGKGKGKARHGHGETIVKRARGHGHDDDHGGTWKIAFADFCLALMCLFLVLWLIASRKAEAVAAQGTDSQFDGGRGLLEGDGGRLDLRDPQAGLDPAQPRQDKTNDKDSDKTEAPPYYESTEELEQLAQRLRQLGDAAGLSDNLALAITDEGLRVLLHDTDRRGVFQLGSSAPAEPFRPLLRQLGGVFAGIGNPIVVVGHTDARPYRDRRNGQSNWHLSSARALAARNLLLAGGMPEASVLQSIGMAAKAPIEPANPSAAINRRIEFLVLGRAQARSLQQMFGVPQQRTRLIDGVDAVGRLPGATVAAASTTGQP